MITVLGLLSSRNDLKPVYAPKGGGAAASAATPLLNVVVDRSQKGIAYARGAHDLDAISQFFFPSLAARDAAARAGTFDVRGGCDPAVVAEVRVITAFQNTVIAPPDGGPAVKRMSLLRKRPEMPATTFQDEWFNTHAFLVKRLPGVLGYRQNIVVDSAEDDALNIQGVVELWFADGAAVEAAFQSDRGQTTMMHAREFLSEITTFLVDPVPLPTSA